MKKYGVMLIGCGHIGKEHIEDIYFRDEFSVLAVVDRDPARVADFQNRYHVPSGGGDYRPFLQDPNIEIVIIATYADTHIPILTDCLEAGKHVLCEKPLGSTVADGKEFCRLVNNAPTKVLVAHILRHNLSYQTIYRLIQEGTIGELKLMRMVQNHHALNWERYKRLMKDCPPIVDCGVHYLDVMQWFTGSKIQKVSGISAKLDPDSPCDNFGMIHVHLQNGCVGYYEAGWGRSLSAQNIKEFVGDKGRIVLTLQNNRFSDYEEGDLITVYHGDTGEYRTINVDAKYKNMYAQLKYLVDMIENDTPANPSIEEVFGAFRAAVTAQKAIEQGAVLDIPSDHHE